MGALLGLFCRSRADTSLALPEPAGRDANGEGRPTRALLFPAPPSAAAAARIPYRGRKGSDERYSGFLAQVETMAFAAAVGRSSLLGLGRCVCHRCLLIKSASACSSMSFPFRLPRRRRLLRWVAADLSRLPSRCSLLALFLATPSLTAPFRRDQKAVNSSGRSPGPHPPNAPTASSPPHHPSSACSSRLDRHQPL